MRRTRHASLFLVMVWVGPVTYAQTDPGPSLRYVPVGSDQVATRSRVIPAGHALLLEPGTPIKLRLKDGHVLHGHFLGRALLDSAFYEARFTMRSDETDAPPLVLGETLQVALVDGSQWTAPFAGYGELSLLVRGPDGKVLRVPFEFARQIHTKRGERVDPRTLTRAFQKGHLPSAEALAVGDRPAGGGEDDPWITALRVPVEDIESITAQLPSGAEATGGSVLLGAAIGVAVFITVIAIAVHASRPSPPSCGAEIPPLFTGIQVNPRPFDRDRGCFVGDPLAVADPWPATSEASPATAQADRAPTDVAGGDVLRMASPPSAR